MSLNYPCLRASDYTPGLKIGILSRISRLESTWCADGGLDDTVKTFCFRVRFVMRSVHFGIVVSFSGSLHGARLIGRRRLTPGRVALMQIRHGLYSRLVVVFFFHPPPPPGHSVLSPSFSFPLLEFTDTYPHADGNSASDDVVQQTWGHDRATSTCDERSEIASM